MVKTDKNSVELNNFEVTRTIVLDLLNIFDRIGRTTGLPYKIKFYCVHVKIYLIIESFSCSGRLSVLSNIKSSSKSAINSGVRRNSIFEYVILIVVFGFLYQLSP